MNVTNRDHRRPRLLAITTDEDAAQAADGEGGGVRHQYQHGLSVLDGGEAVLAADLRGAIPPGANITAVNGLWIVGVQYRAWVFVRPLPGRRRA